MYAVVFMKLFFEIYMSLLSFYVGIKLNKVEMSKIHRSLLNRGYAGSRVGRGAGRQFRADLCSVSQPVLRLLAPQLAQRTEISFSFHSFSNTLPKVRVSKDLRSFLREILVSVVSVY